MDTYVDGFLIPVATDRIDDYKAIASLAGQVWKDHGALAYCEPIFLIWAVRNCVKLSAGVGLTELRRITQWVKRNLSRRHWSKRSMERWQSSPR